MKCKSGINLFSVRTATVSTTSDVVNGTCVGVESASEIQASFHSASHASSEVSFDSSGVGDSARHAPVPRASIDFSANIPANALFGREHTETVNFLVKIPPNAAPSRTITIHSPIRFTAHKETHQFR